MAVGDMVCHELHVASIHHNILHMQVTQWLVVLLEVCSCANIHLCLLALVRGCSVVASGAPHIFQTRKLAELCAPA